MTIPQPIRLFHITATVNLPGICAAGALFSKSNGNLLGIPYQNIAHAGAQGARSIRAVPNLPGGVVHDFVPFYFAPRSPMLFAVNGGRSFWLRMRLPWIGSFVSASLMTIEQSRCELFLRNMVFRCRLK